MEVSGQNHIPSALPQGDMSVALGMGGWLGPRSGLNSLKRTKIFFSCREATMITRLSSPWPSHCTDYAIFAVLRDLVQVICEAKLYCVR